MEDAVRSILLELVKKQIMRAIVSAIPWLGGGIMGTIVSFFVGKLAEFLIDKTILGMKILSNNFEVNAEVRELENAITHSKQENLTDEQKEQILKRMRAAADNLIRL